MNYNNADNRMKLRFFERTFSMRGLRMPDCAGFWAHRSIPPDLMNVRHLLYCQSRVVEVTETPSAGRLCQELKMGGSAICGFRPWSGEWTKLEECKL